MTYQNTGYRRVKNPRIWSMHDLALLCERGSGVTKAGHTADAVRPAKTPPPRTAHPEGLVFRAPLTGRIYLRPSPDEPPFVEVGDVIGRGTTVCLMEAMKSFNRIPYGGDLLPERARVVRFQIEDGSDVDQDMAIFELEAV